MEWNSSHVIAGCDVTPFPLRHASGFEVVRSAKAVVLWPVLVVVSASDVLQVSICTVCPS